MENEKNYLEYLAELYPTIEKAATEIINLQSVINLPKGTEHFLSDIHGEYEAFSHVLRNGSGAVRKKIDDVFGHTLGISEKRALATLIYYPRERLEMEKKQQEDIDDWYKVMLYRLIAVCKYTASKYTREKVRHELPDDFAFVIEELITEKDDIEAEPYADVLFRLPKVSTLLQPLLAVVPLQFFACELATIKGYDVDQPRNLAKSVTVE